MARPVWDFVYTDNNYVPQGAITNAASRSVAFPLNGIPTLSFQIPMAHPLAAPISGTNGYIKAYRDRVLQFFGPIISAEESVDRETQSLAVNAAGVGWFLARRYSGKSASGTPFTNTDRAQIVKALIDTANLEGTSGTIFNGDTAIATSNITGAASPYVAPGSGGRPIVTGVGGTGTTGATATYQGRPASGSGSATISAASTVSYIAGPYKTIFDVIKDLSPGVDGFDWQIVPYDNYTAGAVASPKIGEFRAYPLIGAQKPDAVFEYGEGRNNIAGYRRTISSDTQANRVYHNASAGPDAPGYPTVSALNVASINQWRLMEDLINVDLLDPTLRQRMVDEHIRVRAYPRQTVEFTPVLSDGGVRVPNFGVDFNVGDQVRARVVIGSKARLDAWMRVYGVSFEISDTGAEQMSLTLTDE